MSGPTKPARQTGSPQVPHNARPRPVTPKRGGDVSPVATKPRFTGSAQTNSMKPEFVPRVVTRKTGDSKTMTNPVK